MDIGIKFCGHCAPRRDMALFLEELKEKSPDHNYVYHSRVPDTDILLVLCACNSACATVPDDPGCPVITVTPFDVDHRSVEPDELAETILMRIDQLTLA